MENNYIEQKKNTNLYFQIGDNKYSVSTSNVLEIIKLPALDYPQKLPNNIVGLLKYNNFVINVLDIRFYLDIEVPKYSIKNELLIIKTDEVIYGIITDKIIGVLPFDSALVDQIPFSDSKMIIESLYKYQNETIFNINVYAIEQILKSHEAKYADTDVKKLLPSDAESLAIMKKRTEELTQKASMLNYASYELHTKDRYISFNLNNDYYCIPLNYVKEVLMDTSITNIPGTPDFIEGIMNLRGDYLTVINLKKFLNLPSRQTFEKNPVIVINGPEYTLALLIDKINELFDFSENTIEKDSDNYYIGKFIYSEILYTVLNVEKISTDKRIIVTDI